MMDMIKRIIAIIPLCVVSTQLLAQQRNCECTSDYGRATCDTIRIENIGMRIRSCDSDSVYFDFLPYKYKTPLRITAVEAMNWPHALRLGVADIKVVDSTVKFTYGCTATYDVCLYKVYDMKTGKLYQAEQ